MEKLLSATTNLLSRSMKLIVRCVVDLHLCALMLRVAARNRSFAALGTETLDEVTFIHHARAIVFDGRCLCSLDNFD